MDDKKFNRVRKSISGDEKSKRFLRALEDHYGSASTTDVRRHAKLDRNEVNYRFRKLSKLDIIEVEYDRNPHPRRADIKIATLTDFGQACLDRGITADFDDEQIGTTVEQELRERVSDLEAGVNARDERISQLQSTVNQIQERIRDLERGETPKAYELENLSP